MTIHHETMDTKGPQRDSTGDKLAQRSQFGGGRLFLALAVGVILYFGRGAFIPIALALLISLVLSGPVEALHRIRVPRSLSASLILLIALSIIGGVVTRMWAPTQQWFANSPQTMVTLKQKVRPVAKFLDRLEELRKSVGTMDGASRSASRHEAAPLGPPAPGESAPMLIVDIGGSAVAGGLTFIIVSLFLLAGGPPMMARMVAAFADNLNSSSALNVIEKVREEVGRFYLATTLINVGLGLATGVAMWAWGMPNPFLWGALAAIFNYIPYAGPGTTLLVITVVATVSFTTLAHIVGVSGTYAAFTLIEGQLVQPLFVGRRMDVNPLLIFLGLWFGGLFWGIAGIVLATPTLVALKVIAKSSENGGPMLKFLGPNINSP